MDPTILFRPSEWWPASQVAFQSSLAWVSHTWATNPGHLIVEVICIAIILYLMFKKPYDPKTSEKLSKKARPIVSLRCGSSAPSLLLNAMCLTLIHVDCPLILGDVCVVCKHIRRRRS
jgi:hypothetical protein